MPRSLNFTRGEARAVLHRLETWDCIADALEATHDPAVVAARAEELERELRNNGALLVREGSGLDAAILVDCIESSTWPAIHDPAGNTDNTPQAYNGAVRCLHAACIKIAAAFGLDPDSIEFPPA